MGASSLPASATAGAACSALALLSPSFGPSLVLTWGEVDHLDPSPTQMQGAIAHRRPGQGSRPACPLSLPSVLQRPVKTPTPGSLPFSPHKLGCPVWAHPELPHPFHCHGCTWSGGRLPGVPGPTHEVHVHVVSVPEPAPPSGASTDQEGLHPHNWALVCSPQPGQ